MSKQAEHAPMRRPGRRPTAPEHWTRIGAGGPAPFVSWVTYRLEDGSEYTWRSRQHRKAAGPQLYADRAGLRTTRRGEPVTVGNPWQQFWAPHRLAWWIAVLFIVGTGFFVLGAAGSLVPSLFGGQHPMSVFAETCYFIGALFFTVALYGQLLEGINTNQRIGPDRDSLVPTRFRWLIPRPDDFTRLEVLAALVFLAGSLTFNYETADSLGSVLGWVPRIALWHSTMIGSTLFLVASLLQYVEASNGYLRLDLRDISWWIGVLFIVGSVGFIIGSLPGLGPPGMPDAKVDAGALIVKLGFLLGSIAYLAGSYLLLPELFTELRRQTAPAGLRRPAAE